MQPDAFYSSDSRYLYSNLDRRGEASIGQF